MILSIDPIAFFRNLKQTYKHLGFKKLLKKAVFERYEEIIYVKDVNEEKKFTFKHNVVFRNLEINHLSVLEEFCKKNEIGGENPAKVFNDYYKNNCRCFIAELEGTIIGYAWWGNNKMSFDLQDPDLRFYGKEIKLKDDDAYAFDLLVAPQYRGSGKSIEFVYKFFSALHELGYNRIFGAALSSNAAARMVYKRLRCKETRRVLVRRLFLFLLIKDKKLFFDISGHNRIFDNMRARK